jgi:LPXTG-site transpeptidase (sortase) family protein
MATNSAQSDSSPSPADDPSSLSAADVIRQKLTRIYSEEPDAETELKEAKASRRHSKHQQFMYELSTSGKDLATIQTEWHNYYQALPPEEQQNVWQEFYDSQLQLSPTPPEPETKPSPEPDPQTLAIHKHQASRPSRSKPRLRDARNAQDIQAAIRHNITAGGKLEAKHHVQSLLFGLSMGAIVVLIFLFGFFNEVVLSPFIKPGRVSADAPLIVSNDTVAPSAKPEIIIPKINVQIPVDYNQTTIEEKVLETALDNGILHYPTTSRPGENGNAAFFGHSSNNIFNKGKYKFAFVMLNQLTNGDTFYLTHKGKVYVYKVFSKKVVEPHQVEVLNPIPDKTATATLITCDPPGTSLKRLVVVGEQVSPSPADNSKSTGLTTATRSQPSDGSTLIGNGPTAWTRFIRTPLGKVLTSLILLAAFVAIVRWVNAPARQQRARQL